MRRIEREPAFLLHLRPYRETSVLIEALSATHGRIGLIARGVRSARPRWPRGMLEPFQALTLGFAGRGELAQLTTLDADSVLPRLVGERLLCGLYINELTLRLLARDDPHPQLFDAYRDCLVSLHGKTTPGWALRCFERDLLGALGYAPSLSCDATGVPVDKERWYRLDPEAGAMCMSGIINSADPNVFAGAELLALAGIDEPDAGLLRGLRRLTRALLRPHLGDRALRSSEMLMRMRKQPSPIDT